MKKWIWKMSKGTCVLFILLLLSTPADAHRSGCHRWHSCPSDSGSYVCGDLGYTSGCPQTKTNIKKAAPPEKKKPAKKIIREFTGEVIRVIDGDTLKVKTDNQVITVRLAGIDCPEKEQPYGNAAWRFTLLKAATKTVTVKVMAIDRFGRTIGEVIFQDGTSLNRKLLKAGLAWWYEKYSNDLTLKNLEKTARNHQVGLWKSKKPISPWAFRG